MSEFNIRRMWRRDIPLITTDFNPDISEEELSLYARMFDSYVLEENEYGVISYITLCGNSNKYSNPCFPLHLVSLGTHPDWRMEGLTTHLIREVLETYQYDFKKVQLEVRRSNIIAYKFYNKNGFYMCDILQDYYNNPREDAIVMCYDFKN